MEADCRTLELPRARLLALTLPGAFRPPSEAHREPRVAIVLEGSVGEEIARRTREHLPGDIRVVPADAPHRLTSGTRGLRCLVVELPIAAPWIAGHRATARRTQDPPSLALAETLAGLLSTSAAVSRVRALRVGAELAARAARLGRGLEGHPKPAWLAELGAELAREAPQRLSLATLGRRSGVHPMHVARAFREHHGCSLGEWLRSCRLERACGMLARRDDARASTLADIAAEAGFADQAHLTRSLQRTLGTTPARLRRGHGDVSRVQDPRAGRS